MIRQYCIERPVLGLKSRNKMNKHACIPRTQYFFSINGPGKCVQIYPFKLEKLKKSSKGKKDTAKRVHKARYLVMKIMTLKKRLEERFESIKSLDFPTYYKSNCFLHSRLSTFQVFC